jgi:hypothetical protein
MLYLCYQFYEISEDKAVTYNITDLTRLVWLGDKHIADFLISWNTVVGGMRGRLGEEPIHQWFYEQVKKSVILKEEVAHYDRVDKDHPHKSYKWLMGAVRKHVMVKRRDLNREKNVARAFTGVALPGSTTPAKPQGKGPPTEGKQCTLCGRRSHTKEDCWSSEETKAKYRDSKKNGKKPDRSKSPGGAKGRGRGGKDKKGRSRSRSPPRSGTLVMCWGFNRGECTAAICPHGRSHTPWSKEEEERANRARSKSPAAPKKGASR